MTKPLPILKRVFVLLVAGVLLQSCASYKTQYARNIEQTSDWDSLEFTHHVFLIGDAGYVDLESGASPALDLLQQKLEEHGAQSTVLFLGDNIYPKGMPDKDEDEKREAAEEAILAQLGILNHYEGNPYFIPGNHDWGGGYDAVLRQQKYVQRYINEKVKGVEDEDDYKNYWLPEDACSGPEVIDISPYLCVIIIDTQWWLSNWDEEPRINDGCPYKSRREYAFYLEEAFRKNRHKNVIVASHHPIDTYGSHGGYYTWKSHLFPLSELNPKYMVPVPVVGSIALMLRASIGTSQDLSNGKYKEMVDAMVDAGKKNGEYVFVSGHDHNQQYIQTEGQHQVIAGSGSKSEGTHLTRHAQYTSSDRGFAEIAVTQKGEMYVRYWSAEEKGGKVLFTRKLKGELKAIQTPESVEIKPLESYGDSIRVRTVTYDLKPSSGWRNFWLGEHYKDLYFEEINFPVLDLQELGDSVWVLKRGGGNQTNSLRLVNEKGEVFNMRSVSKDAGRLLPYPFNKIPVAEGLVIESFLSTHAFAAVAVPTMAEAAGIHYTEPSLYYVPKQLTLGNYNRDFGDEVYLIEERIDEVFDDHPNFGYPEDVESTSKVVDKITRDHNAYVNQELAVRSRLFDLMIGDWDRHDDQWKWAEREDEEGNKVYEPIPRDRDQVFSKYDGAVLSLARQFPSGFLHQLRPYSEDVKDVRWAGWSARYFDRTFTNQMEWWYWEQQAKAIQESVTDEVIKEAFRTWPPEARSLTQEEIEGYLKVRRDNIVKIARELYEFLALEVDILGTNKKDLFAITYLDDDRVEVNVWDTNKEGEKEKLTYHRIFHFNETRELHLYGMDDEDIFHITGTAKGGPVIRMIGGLDEDTFIDESKVSGIRGRHLVYDNKKADNDLEGRGLSDKRSRKRELNIYNRRDTHYEYDIFFALPFVSYFVENGLSLGAVATLTTHKFKKSPFGSEHRFGINYSFGTNAINAAYLGTFTEVIGRWDLRINGTYYGQRYSTNFFGLGNETENVEPPEYYRVRQELLNVFPALQRRMAGDEIIFRIGPKLNYTRFQEKPQDYLDAISGSQPVDSTIFTGKLFGGIKTVLTWDGRNDQFFPTKGGSFRISGEWTNNLENSNDAFLNAADLGFYFPLGKSENLVVATRVGYGLVTGQYEFFQAASLGERSISGEPGSLRGFRFDRFRGNTKFYHNTDLRWRISGVEGVFIPFSFGIFGGLDYGRVWLKGENSSRWHAGYGGGLWIAPVDYVVISAGLFNSVEDTRFYLRLGFPF